MERAQPQRPNDGVARAKRLGAHGDAETRAATDPEASSGEASATRTAMKLVWNLIRIGMHSPKLAWSIIKLGIHIRRM